jgi:hypothetical protein
MTHHLTWQDMLDALDTWEPRATAGERESASTAPNKRHWAGSRSLKEAMTMLHDGWAEGLAKINARLSVIAPQNDSLRVRKLDVGGAYPIAALAAAGDMFCMVTTGEDFNHKPVVRLMVNGFMSSGIEHSQKLNQGIGLVQMVDALETSGRRVELCIYFMGEQNGKTYDIRVDVKAADQPLELDRLAFAFMHPSMFRRIGFALIENFYDQENDFPQYGMPRDLKQGSISDTVIVPSMDYRKAHEYATAEAAFKTLALHVGDAGIELEGTTP